MTDNELILDDRLRKIKQVVSIYGEKNFYVSFSGGKDSTVVHTLIDMAIPNNKIPRVYVDTGIELNIVRDFVLSLSKKDNRFMIIKPKTPIKEMLEKEGYPFKSKYHSKIVNTYNSIGIDRSETVKNYLGLQLPKSGVVRWSQHLCPKILRYQFYEEMPFRISSKCCDRLKKDPLHKFSNDYNKPYAIIGIMAEEGGQRESAKCLAFTGSNLTALQPLATVSKSWEEWLIKSYNIQICDIYKPPYNFVRTGCKGCPFSITLQDDLETLQKYFPNERKQCEIIWQPVYNEYRRLNYRLKGGVK